MPGARLPWDCVLARHVQRVVPGRRYSTHTRRCSVPRSPLLLSEPWSRSAGQHPAFLPLLPAWNAAQSFSAYRQPCGAPARPGAAGVCGGHWRGGRLPGSRSGILVRAELDVVLAAQATGKPCFTPACRAIWAPGEPSAGRPAGTGNFIGGQSASFWGPHLDC